jgi:YfiH family protein
VTASEPFLRAALLDAVPGLTHGFTTRHGGVSAPPFDSASYGLDLEEDPAALEENLTRLGRAAGFEPARLRTVQQVHGAEVVRVEAADGAEDVARRQADALWTDAPGVVLGVRTADCVPIVLADEGGRAVAVVHAGWRGTARRVPVRAVEALRRAVSCAAGALRGALGPAIGPCCFEVGDEVVEGLRAAVPGAESAWRSDGRARGKHMVDLWAANGALLRGAGLTAVEALRRCTSCNRADFFSHRRDQGRTGRHLAFALVRTT